MSEEAKALCALLDKHGIAYKHLDVITTFDHGGHHWAVYESSGFHGFLFCFTCTAPGLTFDICSAEEVIATVLGAAC